MEACHEVVRSEAAKIGARDVQAVSAGPDRRSINGRYTGAMEVRVTYPQPGGYEVRMPRMTCVVDREGRIVDAFVAES